MAKTRVLVKRRKAVRNIRKITRTMELIATARFKKAMDRATEAAAYTKKINEIVADLSQANLKFSHPLLQKPEEETNVALLVLTSNRGLCGGYNSGILRQAIGRLREFQAEGKNVQLEVSGKRGLAFMKFERRKVDQTYTTFEDKPASMLFRKLRADLSTSLSPAVCIGSMWPIRSSSRRHGRNPWWRLSFQSVTWLERQSPRRQEHRSTMNSSPARRRFSTRSCRRPLRPGSSSVFSMRPSANRSPAWWP